MNVDLRGKPDVRCNVERLPFADAVFDEVHGHHVVEHFTPHWARVVIAEVYRVLKIGGLLVLELPDLHAIARRVLKENVPSDYVLAGLYGLRTFGAYKGRESVHKFGYTFESLRLVLNGQSFVDVKRVAATRHVRWRDMRVEARKQ